RPIHSPTSTGAGAGAGIRASNVYDAMKRASAAGYMLPLISGTQVVAALLLLSNRFVPLALAVLAPVIVNIVLFHAFLYPAGAIMAGITTLLYLYLVWTYRSVYAAMLAMRVDTSRL
ncbi:MAG: hypothetical protein ACHQQP_04270, partial [Gemmatimonadales bacterium]